MAGFQQVRVSDQIIFNGGANHQSNVDGDMKEVRKHFHDEFMQDTLSTDYWTATVPGSGDTIAISEESGGCVLLSTGDQDDDSMMLAGPIIYRGTKNPTIAGRVTITDVSGTAIFFGFTDAKTEANNSIAIHYAANSLTTVAADAVGFVCDADHTSSLLMCCGVYGDTDATAVSTGITWTDAQTKNLRIELRTGTADFYVDNVWKASIPTAVTSTTLLCPSLHVMTRAADGINTVKLRRIDVWQDED